jgi:hypothetical protein
MFKCSERGDHPRDSSSCPIFQLPELGSFCLISQPGVWKIYVETLVAHRPVEALHEGVPDRFAGLDELQLDAVLGSPIVSASFNAARRASSLRGFDL